jgi:lysophospholipase L1-like esterase
MNLTNGGKFSLLFASNSDGSGNTVYPSKVDFHQISGGFNGHFWFAHTQSQDEQTLQVIGSWAPNSPLNAWTRVLVHVPDHGAHTQQARYHIQPNNGTPDEFRAVPTRYEKHNTWLNLGVFDFRGQNIPRVSLSNFTYDGVGNDDIAFDAVAFVKLPGKPHHFYVNMGDSYSSGEGVEDYDLASDSKGGDGDPNRQYGNGPDPTWDACRRSPHTQSRVVTLPGESSPVGTLADSFSSDIDYVNTACSGATAGHSGDHRNNMIDNHQWGWDGQFHELPQIEKGWLDDNTTLVTLSIGGNDTGFGDIASACISVGNTQCASGSAGFLPAPISSTVPQHIQNDVRPAVQAVIAAIRAKAKNATIVLLGYPQLFDAFDNQDCVGLPSVEDRPMLRGFTETLNSNLAQAVMGVNNAYFVDPVAAFNGHGSCSDPPVSARWLHNVMLTADGNADILNENIGVLHLVSRSSFHPNSKGANAYAAAIADELGRIGYHGN